MGAWGVGSFENDQALDWAIQLAETDDLAMVAEALDGIGPDDDYVDVDAGADVIAASEVIAALRGRPDPLLPDEIADWVKAHAALDVSPYVPRALALLEVVLSVRSELRQLWEENAESYAEWRQDVADLMKRVGG